MMTRKTHVEVIDNEIVILTFNDHCVHYFTLKQFARFINDCAGRPEINPAKTAREELKL